MTQLPKSMAELFPKMSVQLLPLRQLAAINIDTVCGLSLGG